MVGATREPKGEAVVSSGNAELDEVLSGGFTGGQLYLIEGNPGTGKTTLGLQFLLEGFRQGEAGLYVTLSETERELRAVARSHGWSLDGITIHELVDPADSLHPDSQYAMFEPSEVELGVTTKAVLERVESLRPRRLVFDSLSEMRLLAQSPLRYRRQILALKQFFVGRQCTVLLLDDKSSANEDLQLQSIAHGVISLEHILSDYGRDRRRLRVVKYRGRDFQGGHHEFDLRRGGLAVYPRQTTRHHSLPARDEETLFSGNAALDDLMGGGLPCGSSTLLLGPAGVGKSSCATLYAITAAERGDRGVIFAFDESREMLLRRSLGLGMDLRRYEETGNLEIQTIDPGELTPGDFAHRVRAAVRLREDGIRTSVVVIDSLNGFLSAMPEERFLQMQMHELLGYLGECGVSTFLTVAQHGMLGTAMQSPVDASYLADTVLLFRYFEAGGSIRQAISVVKKRSGRHERSIREFRLQDGQILVGEPLTAFHGILSGTPTFAGDEAELMRRRDA